MAPDSQTRKIFLFLLGFTLLLTTVSAAPEIKIDSGDEVIWAESNDHTLNAEVRGCNNSVEKVEIQESSGVFEAFGQDGYNNSTGEYTYNFTDAEDEVATYDIIAECESGNAFTEEFVVDEMRMDLESPKDGDTWYVGVDNEPVDLSFTSEENSFASDNLRRIDVLVDGEKVRDKTDDFDSNMLLGIRGEKLEDILGSEEDRKEDIDFQIKAYYGDNGDVRLSKARTIEMDKWRVSDVQVNPDKKLTSDQFSDLSLRAEIEYKGTPINQVDDSFGPDNFYLTGYTDEDKSKWFSGDLVDDSTGEYSISLDLVPQNLDRNMQVAFDSERGGDDPVKVEDITVEDVDEYVWSPKVLTPSQSAVEADFKLYYNDGSYENFTSTNGDFSQKIWPGTHDLDITFPEAKLSLSDVRLNEDNSGRNILYDYYFYSNIDELPSNPQILNGIKPVNLLSVEFAYPFERASIDMRYNNEQIDTSDDMKVYECTRWHSNDGECKSDEGWEQISSNDVRTVPASWKSTKYSTAKFSVEPFKSRDNGDILQNAYIVGTSADLVLNGDLSVSGPEGGTVATSSQIEVEGNINSENENAVEGADVEVAFYQGDTEIDSLDNVQTDITGRFVAKGAAPEEPGNYSVKITADKENYNIMEKEFDNRFETVVEEGIAVTDDGDSQLRLTPGEDEIVQLSVQNTGQTDMNDVSLISEGFNSDYYSVSPSSFGLIEAGEEKTVDLKFELPANYCDNNDCSDYPQLDVSASAENDDGERFEAEETTIYTQLNRIQSEGNSSDTEQASSETDDTNQSGSTFTESVSDLENATGEFLASQSSLNMALGLIMVFMMVLAGAVKKQDGGNGGRGNTSRGDRDGRGGRPRVQKPNVGGSSTEVKEVEPDNDSEADEVDTVVEQIESDEHDVDSQIDAIAGSVVAEEQDDTAVVEVDDEHQDDSEGQDIESKEVDGDEKFVCEETGEEFDTKAALKLHRQINGLDE